MSSLLPDHPPHRLLPDLTQSMASWPAARRRTAIAIALPVSLALGILGGIWLGEIFTQSDTTHYLRLAAGQPAILPFASRQLGPLLVRAFVHLTSLSISTGFVLEALLALIVLQFTTLWLLLRSGAPRFMLAAIVGLFFWAHQFNALVMPDLFYAALLCVFLLLLRRRHFLLAALMMFPLVITRESTLLTFACLLLAGWRLLRLRDALAAAASLLAGIAVVRHLTAHALPNSENISPVLYLVAKIPWNFLKNFLGIDVWANVYTACGIPRWSIPLHLGPLHSFGVCGWQWRYPLSLFSAAISSFGLLPLLVVKCRRPILQLARSRNPAHLLHRFCILYGLISFILAGTLGESFTRLFEYSWPLFLVVLPLLLGLTGANFISSRAALAFLALHLLVSWSGRNIYALWCGPLAIAVYALGWHLLRRSWLLGAHLAEGDLYPN